MPQGPAVIVAHFAALKLGAVVLPLFTLFGPEALADVRKPLKVAVMGCAVNGPGEAKEADLGVACGKDSAILFKKGEVVRKIGEDEIVDVLVREAADWPE